MNDRKKKLLPEITIDAKENEIDIGEESKKIDYELVLKDDAGNKIVNYNAVDKDSTQAKLFIEVTKTDDEEFPDPDDWITYRFAPLEGLKKSIDNSLEIPKEKEKELDSILNKIHGKFIKQHGITALGVDKGGKKNPNEGLKGTDMKYRIEIDTHPEGPGVRIDIYQSENNRFKSIGGERVKINFVWNKRIKVDLKNDGLAVITSPTAPPRWKWWQISLIVGASSLALVGIIFLIFHRQIKDWWKKRKDRKAQLEVF